jgi:hypothetical protein
MYERLLKTVSQISENFEFIFVNAIVQNVFLIPYEKYQ